MWPSQSPVRQALLIQLLDYLSTVLYKAVAPSFIFVPPSFSSLFFPRPALSKSFRIGKSPFFINFDESIVRVRYWSVAYGPLMRALAILVMSQAVPAIH